MTIYVDIDSGTILNGPIYAVDPELLGEDPSDSEAIDVALNHGRMI